MKRLLVLFGIALAVCTVTAGNDDEVFPDYWQNDYDSQWYDEEIEKLGILNDTDKDPNDKLEDVNDEGFDASDANADEKVQEEIQQFLEEPNKELNDYQIEDNRSKLLNEYDYVDDVRNIDANDQEEPKDDVLNQMDQIDDVSKTVEETIEDKNEQQQDSDNFSASDEVVQSNNDLTDAEQNQLDANIDNAEATAEEESIVEPDTNDMEAEVDIPEISETIQDNVPETAQETEQLLNKETDDFDNESDEQVQINVSIDNDEDIAKDLDDLFKRILDDDPDFADLFESSENKETINEQIDQLAESESNSFEQDIENKINEDNNENNIKNDEEIEKEQDDLFDTPSEDVVNEEKILDYDETDQFGNDPENKSNIDTDGIDYDTVDKVYSDMKDDFNKLFETINKLTDSSKSESESESAEDVNINVPEYEAAEEKPFNEENILKLREEQYDDGNTSIEENETAKDSDETVINENLQEEKDNVPVTEIKNEKNMFESEVTSAELDDLMAQFALDHGNELDVQSSDFDKNVAVVNIRITADQPTVVTSPNYPSPYPTNNIVDWLFEGDGMGIELNVTDFSVNGFLGDYLLVKPGGIDETGNDGLIFSYNLNTERRYRFLDVNRMFVRFEAKAGMAFTRGFSFSVKLITPPTEELEDVPDTEALVDPPSETLLVYVAGVVPSQFANISEEFRVIVADMATLYLNRAGDNIGEKTTLEVTQITRTASCNINWPGFERCTAVRFGIPLSLPDDDDYRMTEDDLHDMWSNMLTEDPFLSRMRRLGITEFAVPSEDSTLLVWVVISIGVVISAAMLGLALWRWSCFEDYTRMAPYSDTDSVIDKKTPLELFPAPHQHLPALYDDDFVKYDYDTTRVDLGGYTNKSYSRDADLFDIDSDDDVRALPASNRDRFTTDV